MKYLFAFAFALVFVAGCGGGDYQAPPKGNGLEPAPNRTQQPDATGKQPTGPSQAAEYDKASKAAFAARDTFRNDKTAETFAVWGAHIYDALRYRIVHDRNGHSTRGFARLKDLNEMYTDWRKTTGPSGWQDNEKYKKAKAAYDEVQQSS